MDEREWLNSNNPSKMLWQFSQINEGGIGRFTKLSNRKLSLFVCACCRKLWPKLTDERSKKAIEILELYVNGQATRNMLELAREEAIKVQPSYRIVNQLPGYIAGLEINDAIGWITNHGRAILSSNNQCNLIRELIGNPYNLEILPTIRPHCPYCGAESFCITEEDKCGCKICYKQFDWQNDWFKCPYITQDVINLAQTAYRDRENNNGTLDNNLLTILADALEEAGLQPENNTLKHLHKPDQHYCGCWALDLILGKK